MESKKEVWTKTIKDHQGDSTFCKVDARLNQLVRHEFRVLYDRLTFPKVSKESETFYFIIRGWTLNFTLVEQTTVPTHKFRQNYLTHLLTRQTYWSNNLHYVLHAALHCNPRFKFFIIEQKSFIKLIILVSIKLIGKFKYYGNTFSCFTSKNAHFPLFSITKLYSTK